MATIAKIGRRERPTRGWLFRLLENLRSQLTWLDLLIGAGGIITISLLMVGFRYQAVPDYKPADIAREDVRAFHDITYEDSIATERKREAAKALIPAVYDLDTDLIASREAEISKLFAAGRRALAEKSTQAKGGIRPALESDLLKTVFESTSSSLPEGVRAALLKQRFDPSLEGQMLKLLGTVMRAGIVQNRTQFLKDQRTGLLLRDVTTGMEQQVSVAYTARDLAGAREYLRQFHLEFGELSASDRRGLFNFLDTLLAPTLVFNSAETNRRWVEAAGRIMPVEGQIKKGRTIVRSGDVVTPTIVSQLTAMRKMRKPKPLLRQFVGFFLVVATLVYALWRYFVHYQNRHRKIRDLTVLILVILAAVLFTARLLTALADILSDQVNIEVLRDPSNLYFAIPIAFGAVLVTLLLDTNLGIFVSMTLAILTGLYYGDVYLGAYVIFGSLAGIYSVRQYRDRAAILEAGLTIGIVNALGILAIDLLRQSPLTAPLTVPKLGLAFMNGILTSTIVSMLLPALESLFKITTDIRLLELSNLNAPILRRLSVEAPGTYHHSLMVGTLAESAAEAVGANPLLVRVAAYYHDLGKMLKPEYFVENQVFGINKHETLSPSMSCLIIASHVKDGLELAKEIGLAERIRDMIPQHHGTRLMTYFYQKAKDSAGVKNQEIVETDFRYPGPKPQSKEAAIMMMADSVEAASRTLSNPTAAQIQGMINRLVDAIIADNQFDECDINLREIRLVKESFFKILTGIYHRRIDYPGYDFNETTGGAAKPAARSPSSKQATAV